MITRDKFDTLRKVRDSGETNMFDMLGVRFAALRRGAVLSEEEVRDFVFNYETRAKEFGISEED